MNQHRQSRLTPIRDEVVAFYLAGHSCQECAERFGLSGNAVHEFLIRNGVAIRSRSEALRLVWNRNRENCSLGPDPGFYAIIEARLQDVSTEKASRDDITSTGSKRCPRCGLDVPRSGWGNHPKGWRHRAHCKTCRRDEHRPNWEKLYARRKERSRELRNEVLQAYGGQCSCCGVSHWQFLAIDHVFGGGQRHREYLASKKIKTYESFLRWLKRHGYPPEFRLLCHNCNLAVGFYGHCPHKGHRLPDLRFDHLHGRERARMRKRATNRALRVEVLAAYGNQCSCCGESTYEHLAVDHVNGGGRRHFHELWSQGKSNQDLLRQLKNDGFPPKYRILCHNCNFSLGLYGSCPHNMSTRKED